MPSYLIEVTTERGTERHAFTLDDDRPLGPQVTQVLEELRQRGVLLRGGRDDELGVYWSGRELDRALAPAAQGVSPARPVELRMRQRTAAAPPVERRLPRGVLASAAWGYAGALVAWLVSGLWTDAGPLVSDYDRLDLVTMLVLGGATGAAVLAGAALRRRESVVLTALAGFGMGGGGAFMAALLAVLLAGRVSIRGFVVARVLGWALAGGLAAPLLSLWAGFEARKVSEALVAGLMAGAVAGVAYSLPGPAELWQGFAFLAFGAGVGLAACGPALWHAAAIVDGPAPHRAPGILGVREWPIPERGAIDIGRSRLAIQGGRLALYPPPGGAEVDGVRVASPMFLPGGSFTLDGIAYHARVWGPG
ncbi:MAG TPA: hypothetical protein VJ847_07955 [Gemmatimonadales bacterium]|jgi:hypothetical protein|nr:hypothetical protein [Gemmatimonadales bacterium]